jgi:uncharacterized protein YjbJ (UPF0337 family)
MSNLGSMVLELSANVARFQSDMGKAAHIAEQTAEKMTNTFKNVAGALGLAFSTDAIVEFGKHAIDVADELNKMAQKVGISVEALSALRVQANLSNVATDQLQGGLSKLAKTAADAAGGGKQSAAVYAALGVSVKDAAGNLKPMEVLLGEVAKKFASYQDSAAKTALAQQVFGKSGAELIPYLNDLGQKSLPEVIKQAEEFGAVVSTKTAKAAEDFNDNLTRMKTEAEGFANAVVAQVLPNLVELSKQMVDAGKTTDGYASSASGAATGIKGFILSLIVAKETVAALATGVFAVFDAISTVFNASGQIVQAWVETTAKALKAAFNPFDDDAMNHLNQADAEFTSRVGKIASNVATALQGAAAGLSGGVEQAVENSKKAYDALFNSTTKAGNAAEETGKKFGLANAPIVGNTGAVDIAAKAHEKLNDMLRADEDRINTLLGKADPVTKVYTDWASAILKGVASYEQEMVKAKAAGASNEEYAAIKANVTRTVTAADAALRAQLGTIERERDIVNRITDQYREESESIGLNGRELAIATTLRQGGALALELYNKHLRDSPDLTDKETAALKNLSAGLYDQKEAAELAMEAARGWQSIWVTAANGVADTFAKVLVNGGNLFTGLRDLAKQTVEQIIAYFAKLAVINPILNSVFGRQSGWTQLAQLGSSAITGGGLATSGAIAGGGAYNLLGVGSQGIVSDTIKSLGGIGKIASVFGAAYAGYQIGGSAGAIGLAAAAYFIPVVGWIAGAASIINSLTGGALFGTKYKPTGVSSSSLSIGDTGASITNSFQESKKKALFGGTSYKDVSVPATADQTAGAAALFNAIKSGAEAFAAQFGQSIDHLIGGTYNIATDKAGKQSFTSTVGGQAFSGETQQQFAERLQSANFLAVLDKMGLGASAFVSGLQGDADKLAAAVQDFAQATQAANTDLGNGFHFLALSANATLVDVMKFVEGAEAAGESLTETYKRLATAQTQYNQFVAQFAPQATFVDDFEAALSGVYHSMLQNIDAANQLAIAAGASGAATQDLTNIQNTAAQQMAALVVQLEASAQSLAFSLGLTTQGSLSQVTDEIARLQGKAGQTSGVTSKATKSLGEFVSAVGEVAKAADNAINLLLGNLSPLNDQQKLQIALQGLRAGTVTQEQVLGIGRNLYASSQAYTDLFNQVMHSGGAQSGGGVAGKGQASNAVGSYLPVYNDTSTTAASGLSAEEQAKLDALLKQQAALQAAATMQQYQTLAQQIAEIASAKGETYNQILEEMGVQAADLEKGLGLKSDADLDAYIKQVQATLDSGKENTASIVGALNTLPHAIAAELADIIGKVNASLPSTAGPTPSAPPAASPSPAPPVGSGSGAPPGGRTLSDGDLSAMARMFGSATGEAIASRQGRSSRVGA